jgi:hypothetical protein
MYTFIMLMINTYTKDDKDLIFLLNFCLIFILFYFKKFKVKNKKKCLK